MASIPNYEGNHDQIHGNHFSGEPINRSHVVTSPVAERQASYWNDDLELPVPSSGIAAYGLTASVEPIPKRHGSPRDFGKLPVTDVHVEFI